jgi:hypothetical protein
MPEDLNTCAFRIIVPAVTSIAKSYGTAKEKKIAPEQALRGKYAKQKMNQGQNTKEMYSSEAVVCFYGMVVITIRIMNAKMAKVRAPDSSVLLR